MCAGTRRVAHVFGLHLMSCLNNVAMVRLTRTNLLLRRSPVQSSPPQTRRRLRRRPHRMDGRVGGFGLAPCTATPPHAKAPGRGGGGGRAVVPYAHPLDQAGSGTGPAGGGALRRYEQPINSLDELCKVVRVLLGILSSLLKVQYQLAPLLQPLHRRFTATA